ncbi:hypothetical protein F5B21DRAFT_37076 [Xylaria acuta]|nr:hypothetical protein F5B21DRAFT_37076 [Xylaria acuta]
MGNEALPSAGWFATSTRSSGDGGRRWISGAPTTSRLSVIASRTHPPWVLRELRGGYYARVMRELKMGGRERERRTTDTREGEHAEGPGNWSYEDEDVDITKQSLLILTLDAAIQDPRCRTTALRRVTEKCSRSFEQLDFDFFVDTPGRGI